ncbi:MAG: hypothetical protein KJZ93_02615 [Caldilineaceae bacterium]|nr:hypothetical protein [Caldilineaceae bacterium]
MNKHEVQLQALLDELDRGAPLSALLAAIPETDVETRSVLSLAATLRRLPQSQMDDSTTLMAHQRLRSALVETLREPPPHRWPNWIWRPSFNFRLAEGIALVTIALVGGWLLLGRGDWSNALQGLLHREPVGAVRQADISSFNFEPSAMMLSECQTRYEVSGVLVRRATGLDTSSADLDFGYTVRQGANYVQNIALTPALKVGAAPGERVPVTVHLTLTDAWLTATPESVVRIRILALLRESDTSLQNAPDALAKPAAMMEIIVRQRCAAAQQMPTSPLATPAAPLSPPVRVEHEREFEDEPHEQCETEGRVVVRHPVLSTLATKNNTAYSKLMEWFCQGMGIGEIQLAYDLSARTGVPIEEVIALRLQGLGWGQVMIELGAIQRTGPLNPPGDDK